MLKCTDYESYENYLKDNPNKFKRSDGSKSPNSESPAHTPRKVFSKLNSLKMSSFRSLSIQENHDNVHNDAHDKSPERETVEMSIPKSQSTYSIEIPNSETLWTVDPRPEYSANYFSFTHFAMSLNELEPHMGRLCKTDSRLRPDIRKLENGDVDGAILEKNRLEEKQRETRKARKSKNGGVDDWQPRYSMMEKKFLTFFARTCVFIYLFLICITDGLNLNTTQLRSRMNGFMRAVTGKRITKTRTSICFNAFLLLIHRDTNRGITYRTQDKHTPHRKTKSYPFYYYYKRI